MELIIFTNKTGIFENIFMFHFSIPLHRVLNNAFSGIRLYGREF